MSAAANLDNPEKGLAQPGSPLADSAGRYAGGEMRALFRDFSETQPIEALNQPGNHGIGKLMVWVAWCR